MRTATRAVYRTRQFIGSLRPRVDDELRDEAFGLLNEREQALFVSMTPRDQQHCLSVYRRLRTEGHEDRALLTAALLHDVGKGEIALWHRVVYVLLEGGAPGLLRRSASPGSGRGWRQTFYRCLHHPRLGAELAREAGCSEQVAVLIGTAADDAADERLLALHAADDAV